MRAGRYAQVGDQLWPAAFTRDSPRVALLGWGPQAPGPGFAWREARGGHWVREVARVECSRLVLVATSAYWLGEHPVEVLAVRPDGTADIVWAPDLAPTGSAHATALPGSTAARRLHEDPDVGYRGHVPVDELTTVTEAEHEVPVEPLPGPWSLPRPPRLPPSARGETQARASR